MEQLTINKDCTPEQFDHYCNRLTQAGNAYRFALGDMVALARSKKWLGRDAFKQLQTKSEYSVRSLQQFAKVSKAFPPEARTNELDFSHYAAVASLPEKERGLLLKEAGEKGLSVRDLRKRLRPSGQKKGEITKRIEVAITTHVGRKFKKITRARKNYWRELRKPYDPEWVDQFYNTVFEEAWENGDHDRYQDEVVRFFFHDPVAYALESAWPTTGHVENCVARHDKFGLYTWEELGTKESFADEKECSESLAYLSLIDNARTYYFYQGEYKGPKHRSDVDLVTEYIKGLEMDAVQSAIEEIEYMLS